MLIRVNRPIAVLLLVLLAPVLLPLRLYRWVTGTGKRPVYASTVQGDPLAYSGDRPLVVALWASWASVWKVATGRIVTDLQAEFANRCEFAYVEVTGKGIEERYGVQVTPAVLVYHSGREIGRFINLLEADELRTCVAEAVSAQVAPSPRDEANG